MILKILGVLFVISVFIPVEFHILIGSLRIETYRVVLALALLYTIINVNEVLKKAELVAALSK